LMYIELKLLLDYKNTSGVLEYRMLDRRLGT